MDPTQSSPRLSRSAAMAITPTSSSASASDNSSDPARAKKVTVGFMPTLTSGSATANSSNNMTSSSYKSQIPGWSVEEAVTSARAIAGVSPIIQGPQDARLILSKSPSSVSGNAALSSLGSSSNNLQLTAAPSNSGNSNSIAATDTQTTVINDGKGGGEEPAQLSKAEKKALKQAKRAANKPQQQQQQQFHKKQQPGEGAGVGKKPQGNKSQKGHPQQHHQQQHSQQQQLSQSNAGADVQSNNNQHHQQQQQPHQRSQSVGHQKRSASSAPQTARGGVKEVALFSHLEAYGRSSKSSDTVRHELQSKGIELHPSVLKLGLLYQQHIIIGSNERCISLMNTFRRVISDYQTPANNTLCRHLDSYLKPHINYLVSCRPLGVSMGNAIRYLRFEIAQIPNDMPEDDAKQLLDERILNFMRDRILVADTLIAELGSRKIQDDEVILTYGNSSLIRQMLIYAHKECEISFRVIIVDSRPLLEGRKMLKDLVAVGIKCSYVHLNALSFVLKDTSKVFLGAHALLSNGFVMSRVGSAMVSMMAHELGIPVIICCETYKFSDRVQLDSFVNNELADPDDLVELNRLPPLNKTVLTPLTSPSALPTSSQQPAAVQKGGSHSSLLIETGQKSLNILSDWRDKPDLKLLNLMYDVTSSEFITMVITEVGMIPCSSVPVVLREGVKSTAAHSHHHQMQGGQLNASSGSLNY